MRNFLVNLLLFFQLFSYEAQSSQDVQKLNAAAINTLLIFTAQEGLNSGLYHFTNTDIDIDMEIYHLPFKYPIKSDSNIDYFLVGNVGYSRSYLAGAIEEVPGESLLTYLNHIQTYTAGIGGGISYKVTKEVEVSTGVELIYSRSGASVKKPDGDFGDAIEDFFNANYSDNISYKFFTLGEYKAVIDDFKPYASLAYKLYETKSDFTIDEILSFSSQSSVATLSLGVETPKIFKYNEKSITTEVYVNVNYLWGTVSEIVKLNKYHSFGGIVYYNTPKSPWWASRFFLELNRAKGDGLDGYNVGVGFTLDF